MNTKFIGKKNWLKVSAAAALSIGVLAGCGAADDDEVDVIEPVEDVTPTDETDTEMDIELEDPNAEPGIDPNADPEVDPEFDADVDSEVEPENNLEENDTK